MSSRNVSFFLFLYGGCGLPQNHSQCLHCVLLVLVCFICATCVTPGVPTEPTLSYTHVCACMFASSRPLSTLEIALFLFPPAELHSVHQVAVKHRSDSKWESNQQHERCTHVTPGMTSAGTPLPVPRFHLHSECSKPSISFKCATIKFSQ